jgi:Protein of unknown function (DUF3308).
MRFLDDLIVGYSYDYPTSSIRKFTSGSHEIILGYSFGLGKEQHPEYYKSVRFL